MGLNWVDIVILTITGISFVFGVWRGLVKEVLSLVTWIAALLIARLYSEQLAPSFTMLDGETTRYVAAFALLFVVTMMLGTLLNHLIGKLLNVTGLKATDRFLGGLFGIARGAVIVMLILFIAGNFVAETAPWQQSLLVPYGLALIEWSTGFIGEPPQLSLPTISMPAGVLN